MPSTILKKKMTMHDSSRNEEPQSASLWRVRHFSSTTYRLVAKSEKRPRNDFRGDGMLAAGNYVGWLI